MLVLSPIVTWEDEPLNLKKIEKHKQPILTELNLVQISVEYPPPVHVAMSNLAETLSP